MISIPDSWAARSAAMLRAGTWKFGSVKVPSISRANSRMEEVTMNHSIASLSPLLGEFRIGWNYSVLGGGVWGISPLPAQAVHRIPSFKPQPWQMGQIRVLVFAEVVMSGKPIIRSISGLCRKGERLPVMENPSAIG